MARLCVRGQHPEAYFMALIQQPSRYIPFALFFIIIFISWSIHALLTYRRIVLLNTKHNLQPSSISLSQRQQRENKRSRWFTITISRRAQALKLAIFYTLLLSMELLEGYWILRAWWSLANGFWCWDWDPSSLVRTLWKQEAQILLFVSIVPLAVFGVVIVWMTVETVVVLVMWKDDRLCEGWKMHGDEEGMGSLENDGVRQRKMEFIS